MNLLDRVCQLIEAENEADTKKAEALLATDFVAVTRRNGQEDSRNELLAKIANPPTPNPFREPSQFQMWESGGIGVVRSLVRTKDPSTHAVIGEFRNLHVFRKEGDAWLCVDWQVTELPKGEVPRAAADRLAVAKAYEDGKHRRYALLFSVNGGAFAIAQLLGDPTRLPPGLPGDLRLEYLALGMALFTTVMGVDIDAFGRRMKDQEQELYKGIGVFVLAALGGLIVAGWSLVGFAAWSVQAVAANVAIILGCHSYATVSKKLWSRRHR